MPRASRLALALASALLAGSQTGLAVAQTAQNISSYSSTKPKQCRQITSGGEDGGGTRVCPGPQGLVVVVSEGDLRETVTVGRTLKAAQAEPAAQSWFGPFSSTTPTIEWRQEAKDKPPFAMIQRWHLADIEDEGKDHRPRTKQLFVVTRLAPGSATTGSVCHVAYIDVRANPDAIGLARETADTLARDFNCDTGKVKLIGTSGRAVELALPR